ncbi:MAG: ABC transporter permease [Natronospirillum sp.]|uniref:ABC transporter permease n=1 Tax=Natronospirillum sp. TaxID=2812955 RepID=UPI0025DC60A3|nr:ABC transporter permease [Natronospirillum sp.]MCH8551573.1 ABC transporter permease [Natronospirillum sp.]
MALLKLNPINHQRWLRFRNNRRAFWSLWLFSAIFMLSLFAEFIANERPIVAYHDGLWYAPVFFDYSELEFGGDFDVRADYTDPFIQDLINENGWMLWPPVRFSFRTINYDLPSPAPAPPSAENWLGTDDQGRDVVARLLYGTRISILFGFTLTVLTSIVGIAVGALMGFFGGKLDLFGQRVLEVWSSLPTLFILIIISSMVQPTFWILMGIMLLFGWMGLVGLVRAESLRARNFEYVQAARAMGLGNTGIIFRHVLPNAMVATITFLPFILAGSVTTLTGLDFLGFGLPPGSPSLGEMINQGKNNVRAPWIGLSVFFMLSLILVLLVFIGEGVRDALDPRRTR